MRMLVAVALVGAFGLSLPAEAKEKKKPEAVREIEQSKTEDNTHRAVTARRHKAGKYDDPTWGANFKQTLRENEAHLSHSTMAR